MYAVENITGNTSFFASREILLGIKVGMRLLYLNLLMIVGRISDSLITRKSNKGRATQAKCYYL